MHIDHPVIVVGGGPTGVTVALLLARYGIRSVVLDRWEAPYPQPRAVHLDDEVCRILGRLGLADEFARISRPALGLRLVDRELRTLAEFSRAGDGGQHGYPQANMFDQPDLERLLRDAVGDQPLVTLRGGCDVMAVRSRAEHVEVEFVNRVSGDTEVAHGRYVLGCDGANSVVRQQMGSRMQDLGFEQRWLVVDIETDLELGHWDGVHQVCDPGRAGTFMRIGGTRYRWEFRLLPGETVADLASPTALGTLLDPWLAGASTDQLAVNRLAEYTFRAQIADRWLRGRVLLLGDAAHLTPPFIGQGLGAGLRDAANLSWKLAGVLQDRVDDAILDTYQAERRAHARSMIRLAMLTGQVMTGGGRVGDVLRRAVAPRLRLVPGIRAKVLNSSTPRLRRPHSIRHPVTPLSLAGTLCPNAELDPGTRVDDVTAEFLVVTLDLIPASLTRTCPGVVIRVRPETTLGRWLRRHHVRAAVVRPDGTVLSAGRSTRRLLAAIPAFPHLAPRLGPLAQ